MGGGLVDNALIREEVIQHKYAINPVIPTTFMQLHKPFPYLDARASKMGVREREKRSTMVRALSNSPACSRRETTSSVLTNGSGEGGS